MTDASDIMRRYKAAESIRLAMCSIWRDVGAHVDPLNREIGIDSATGWTPSISGMAAIFDTTIKEAARTFAAGCMSWMTPSETKWFSYNAPRAMRDDDAIKSWYAECTDITAEILAGTNFYSEIHDLYLQDGCYGTSGMFIRENSTYGLHFETFRIGEYSLLENSLREVDTVFRCLRFSPRQCAQEFGEFNLTEEIRKALTDPKKADDECVEVVHFIGPRHNRDRFSDHVKNAPFASVWIEKKNKAILKESGFYESPFAVHRHLRWGKCPYGRSPGMEALFDARQLNYMQQQLDTLVEKQVTPPVIAPAQFEGVVDLRARGITYTEDMQNRPEYFGDPGNYMVGEDRTEYRKRQINNAFHVELFQALASVPIGKQMTAEEVRQRRNDRLPNFSPTFARKNRELNDPIMRQVFSTLLRLGAFPPAPRQLMQQLPSGDIYIPPPNITYTSRMALALQSLHNDAFLDVLTLGGQISAISPEVMDNIDLDEGFRDYARNSGLRESALVPEQRRDEMRQIRAEEQAAAQEEASMLAEGDVAAKLVGAAK